MYGGDGVELRKEVRVPENTCLVVQMLSPVSAIETSTAISWQIAHF